MSHLMQGQATETQSPSPMLEARWETEQHNSSILYFRKAVLSLQVLFSPKVPDTPSLAKLMPEALLHPSAWACLLEH